MKLFLALLIALGMSTIITAEETSYPQSVYNVKTKKIEIIYLTEASILYHAGIVARDAKAEAKAVKTPAIKIRLGRGHVHLNGSMADANTYVVGKGDLLWKIAYAFDISVPLLAKTNGLVDYDLIEIGQKLLVPVRVTKAADCKCPAPELASSTPYPPSPVVPSSAPASAALTPPPPPAPAAQP